MKSLVFRTIGTAAVLTILLFMRTSLHAQFGGGALPPASAYSIPASQLIQPDELNLLLHAERANKPLVLQVGSHMLFAQAHIAGSEYGGAGARPEGLKRLQDRVAPLPKKTVIVLYCGCCPWNHCPNIEPAMRLLRELGFTNVKALYLATNLGSDWVDKGYPVESGD
ncbi:MAG: rhodanese-like domain-containing protein [Terracidiphilus sp.]